MSEQARAKDEYKMQGTHADAPQQPKSTKNADAKKSGNVVTGAVVFLKEVVKEAKKITWPPRSQVVQETTSVIVLVALITVMVLGFDYALGNWVFGPIEHLAKITAPKTDDNGMFTPVAPQEGPGPRTRPEDLPPQEKLPEQSPAAPGTAPTSSAPAPGATPVTPPPVSTSTPAQSTPTTAPPASATPAPATTPAPTAPPATPGASVPGPSTPATPAPATPTTPHP